MSTFSWFIVLAILGKCLLENVNKAKFKKMDVPFLVIAGSNMEDSTGSQGFEKKMVLHFNFDSVSSMSDSTVIDSSGYDNNGHLTLGGLIIQIPGSSCYNAAFLNCAEINLQGETFQAKPFFGVTISAWIYLLTNKGRQSIFETYGNLHSLQMYSLEVDFGILRWSHRNEHQQLVFEVAAEGIPSKEWVHVVGTYNSSTGIVDVFLNGVVANRTLGRGSLSRDWSRVAHIGNTCSNRPLIGFIDELKIFNYALLNNDINHLAKSCTFKDPTKAIVVDPAERNEKTNEKAANRETTDTSRKMDDFEEQIRNENSRRSKIPLKL